MAQGAERERGRGREKRGEKGVKKKITYVVNISEDVHQKQQYIRSTPRRGIEVHVPLDSIVKSAKYPLFRLTLIPTYSAVKNRVEVYNVCSGCVHVFVHGGTIWMSRLIVDVRVEKSVGTTQTYHLGAAHFDIFAVKL